MESFQFVSSLHSYVTWAGTNAHLKHSAPHSRQGKVSGEEGGQEEDLGGRTLGSKPYFTSLYSSATLSPLVFVWNFHRVFFVGGRDVTINLTYWSHPTIWPAVNGHSSSGRYGHSLADTIFLSLQLFPKHFDNCQNSFQLTNVFTRSTDQFF